MPTYTFSGKITIGRSSPGFQREVEAESRKHAEEKLFSELGSEHSVPRSKIVVEEVEETE